MVLFRNASIYLLALAIAVIVGFWPSYFSVPLLDTRLSLHVHGITMLLWLGILVAQPWLIRSGNRDLHRRIGKISYALFPFIVVTGVVVTYEQLQSGYGGSFTQENLSGYFLGFSHVAILAVFYSLAIYHRKNVQLHARYMISTAMALVTPGISRIFFFYLTSNGIPAPDLFATMVIASAIPLALIANDKIRGKMYPPFIYLAMAWAINLIGFKYAHTIEAWRIFAAWSLNVNT